MIYRVLLFSLFIFIISNGISNAQTPGQKKSVMLSAVTEVSPPSIQLNWNMIPAATSFNIYKKSKNSTVWGAAYVSGLPGTTTTYTDYAVVAGESYEYRVYEPGTVANAYIFAGIELPETYLRGIILLVYDSISTLGLNNEIERWIEDVNGDGWEVIKIGVDKSDNVTDVKAKILTQYNNYPQKVKSVFLLGSVPIPYSGEIAPDGHTPDHLGAWPADGYYADMDGNWTDIFVNNAGATQVRNQNIPGDGKFDQNTFPTNLELQIGRVDMRNLPAFSSSETQLLKKYLDKNHAYRHKHFASVNRGLIDDNFTGYAEGFSASGWRNFSVLCGADSIVTTDYFTTMKNQSYQWSYGCGAGSYTSASGIGNTSGFAADSLGSIFTMLFGSYFGDWDSPSNNILRAALANGSTLTNCWSGRPFWYFHHMAMGDNIGYSALVSMNNSSVYDANFGGRGVHTALMGDPTLRAHIIAPVKDLAATNVNGLAQISWTASVDSVAGYHIFRKNDSIDIYQRINTSLITDTSYTDHCLIYQGEYKYMVRAVKLEQTNAGTYYNMSTGITDTLFNYDDNSVNADFNFILSGNILTLTNNSTNAQNHQWFFGDGNYSALYEPIHSYAVNGNYTITLIASSQCDADTVNYQISINVGLDGNDYDADKITVYPNPAQEIIYITGHKTEALDIEIINIQGQIAASGKIDGRIKSFDISNLSEGLYTIRCTKASGEIIYLKFIKQ